MEFFLRFLQLIVKLIYLIVYKILYIVYPPKKNKIPPITNHILNLPLEDVLNEMQQGKLTSVALTKAYIARIKEVNPFINAIVEERFNEALKEAELVDNKICKADNINSLYEQYALLGIPFTVKESCGLKGMSFEVGSLLRKGQRALHSGAVIERLCEAGAIPLLVSVSPEYCFSIETNTYVHGKCLNAYDITKTAGGSSSGEGALNAAGAALFGIGSDIAGSIRIPSLFNGVFGHKPTGGITSVEGHFPGSTDNDFGIFLQLGPITRFARDLKIIMRIIAGKNATQLKLLNSVDIHNIQIYYSLGFTGVNGLLHTSVDNDIRNAILRAVKYFKQKNLNVAEANIKCLHNSTEIAFSGIARLTDFPYLMENSGKHTILKNLKEYLLSVVGLSQYTKDGLIFDLLRRTNSFMSYENMLKYKPLAEMLKAEIIQLLGEHGVLIFPTFHVPAIHHNSSLLALWGIDYTSIFNILGLPATHVPMGLNKHNLPIGFQVIAAPFKDMLCFKIAEELETKFGGWVAPSNVV